MWTCKQVSNSLAEQDYERLSPYRKFLLKLHVRVCVVCGQYNRDVMHFHDAARGLREREERDANDVDGPHLADGRKAALEQQLREACEPPPTPPA